MTSSSPDQLDPEDGAVVKAAEAPVPPKSAGTPEAPIAPVRLPPDSERFSSKNRRRLSGPGLRAFVRIADLWGLDVQQRLMVLGSPAASTYQRWLKAAVSCRDFTLTVDVLMRISAVLGIHAALGVLFSSQQDGAGWLLGKNDAAPFEGRPPMVLATIGTLDGLLSVRRFLDALLTGQ